MGKNDHKIRVNYFSSFYLFVFHCCCYWQEEKQYKYTCRNWGGEKSEEFCFFDTYQDLGHFVRECKTQVGKGTVAEYWAVSTSCLSLFHCRR